MRGKEEGKTSKMCSRLRGQRTDRPGEQLPRVHWGAHAMDKVDRTAPSQPVYADEAEASVASVCIQSR